ncbi:MAG: peptide deformylase Def [Bacteroidetes bacterium HLUCCA01]|nr:MAG: peptide deformylase Def [Bacteroidetes bacterium HLUCCA01]
MAVLPIVLYNDPVLRQKAEPVKTDSKELQVFIDDLFETMYEASGVGLAAPQVGRSLRVFVVDADVMVEDTDEQAYGPMAFINPEIHSKDNQQIIIEEGCLSLPELRENIARPDEITVKFLDRDFREQHMTFTGWMSRVFQHELDHLDGVLFFDYLGSFKKRLIARRLQLIDEGAVETEYPVRERNPQS